MEEITEQDLIDIRNKIKINLPTYSIRIKNLKNKRGRSKVIYVKKNPKCGTIITTLRINENAMWDFLAISSLCKKMLELKVKVCYLSIEPTIVRRKYN
jgi:hypothetical protein